MKKKLKVSNKELLNKMILEKMSEEIYLETDSLSNRWGVAINTLAKWRWKKIGPLWTKVGRTILYKLADIEEFEAQRKQQHTTI